MQQYHTLLTHILSNGALSKNRTGIDTLSIFGYQMRFNLQDGFPLLTTKKIHFKSVVHELLWFLKGDTNIAYLQRHQVNIWNEWADAAGNLGAIYGKQWRSWGAFDGGKSIQIDQIKQLLENLQKQPESRRHIVCAWNVGELDQMALPPCHCLFQFYVQAGKLSCLLYQRSADVFLGVPFNIASYALLTHLIAKQVGLAVGEFIWTGGDVHLYTNHLEQVNIQLERKFLPLPTLAVAQKNSLFDYTESDIILENYQAHPHIPGKVAA